MSRPSKALVVLFTLGLTGCSQDSPECPLPGLGASCSDTCSAGLVCTQGVCRQACADASECPADLECIQGACMPCSQDSECEQGDHCDQGHCRPSPKELAQPCSEGSECASGFCSHGVCCESACDEGCMTCSDVTPGRCLPSVSDGCRIVYPVDTDSIREALDMVADGGMVLISQDSDENIVVDLDKKVTIQGTSDATPTISAAPGEVALWIQAAKHVTVRNLKIDGGRVGLLVSAPVETNLDMLHITHADTAVRVDESNGPGDPAQVELRKCDLFHSAVLGLEGIGAPIRITASRIHGNGRAVRVTGAPSFALEDSILSQSFGKFGVTLSHTSDIRIQSSLFWENNGLGALFLSDVQGATIENCTFNGNATAGIQVQRSRNIEVKDTHILFQVDSYQRSVTFDKADANVDLGGLDSTGFLTLPFPEFEPQALDFAFGDDSWQGNGMTVTDDDDVWIMGVFFWANEGSGLLIRNSLDVGVLDSTITENQRTGITSQSTYGLAVAMVADYTNASAGLQVIDGTSTIESNQLSLTRPTEQGNFGDGLSISGGNHEVNGNHFYEDARAGLFIHGSATVSYQGNWFRESPFAIVHCPGSMVQEGDNDIDCTLGPDDCVTMNCAEPTPAPPPRTPIDPDET